MKKLTILKILFIFFIIIFAIYLSFSKRYDSKGHVEKAFPNLLIDIEKINKISIKDINNEIFINKDNNKWFLKNYKEYPADIKKINNFFINLSNGTFIDKKILTDQSLKKLGLDNTFNNQFNSRRIRLYAENNILYDFIIGKKPNDNALVNINYFRSLDANLIWLFKNNLDLPDEELFWINSKIFNISRWRVHQVKVIDEIKKDSFTIYRSNYSDSNYKFLNLPEGYDLKNSFTQNALAASFENIQITNIFPIDIDADYQTIKDIQLTTFDGLVINYKIIKIDEKLHVRMFFSSDSSVRKEITDDKKIVGIPSMKSFDDVKKEAEFLDFTKTWVYTFDEKTMSEFNKKRRDLLKKK